jgi:hypothetical protein
MVSRMQDFATFQELVDAAAEAELPNGWIYRTRDRADVFECTFTVTTSVEQRDLDTVDVDGDEIPIAVHEKGVQRWIDSATFEDVVTSRENKTGRRDLEDVATAVAYYLENDDFMD